MKNRSSFTKYPLKGYRIEIQAGKCEHEWIGSGNWTTDYCFEACQCKVCGKQDWVLNGARNCTCNCFCNFSNEHRHFDRRKCDHCDGKGHKIVFPDHPTK